MISFIESKVKKTESVNKALHTRSDENKSSFFSKKGYILD